ncbi:MAG: hypothetical protein PUC30_09920 [Lachnospiraceae bacterium]|nr:hypothetical protein [Lachnospiraceae bacterium]
MKWYHFGLFFALIAMTFFTTAQIRLITTMKNEEIRRTEYDCLVAATNAAVAAAFTGAENRITKAGLIQAEEAFFQTLAVLHDGIPDAAGRAAWKQYVPCLVVFDEEGYYRYCYVSGQGYVWSELTPYQSGEIQESFFSETEEILSQYHSVHYTSAKKYRMEKAERGVWEQGLSKACVFALYAPKMSGLGKHEQEYILYAAAHRVKEAYPVTEDNYCHLSSCEQCIKQEVIARYASQKESAKAGAIPCESCMR